MKQALVSLCFAGGIVFCCAVHMYVFVYLCLSGVCTCGGCIIEMTGCHDSLCIAKAC